MNASFRGESPASAAERYFRCGVQPIPVRPNDKRPVFKNWTSSRVTEETDFRQFGEDNNVGVLLGDPSGGLVDTDLDSPIAIKIADRILPNTSLKSGRFWTTWFAPVVSKSGGNDYAP